VIASGSTLPANLNDGGHRPRASESASGGGRVLDGKADVARIAHRLFTRARAGEESPASGVAPIEPTAARCQAARPEGLTRENLRRRAAGGEHSAGSYARLVGNDPLSGTWLAQLDDMTGAQAVDISEEAFTDFFPAIPECHVLRRRRENPAASKKEPPSRGCRTPMIALNLGRLVHSARSSLVTARFRNAAPP